VSLTFTSPNGQAGTPTRASVSLRHVRTHAQTTLQPEAIGVLVVLGVALLALLAVGIALARSRRRRRQRLERLAADTPDPDRFAGGSAVEVIGAADQALYERDGRTAAAAALHLHRDGHAEAMAYLLHALRLAPAHHRGALIAAAASRGPDELAEHPLLSAALDPEVLERLRDAVQDAASGRSGSTRVGSEGTDGPNATA